MEITKHNFSDSLQVVSRAVNEAEFLAIDAEFSGLNIGENIHPFDTPQERYRKLVKAAKAYTVLQFGLTTFCYNTASNEYEVKSFNFYVCPRPPALSLSLSSQSPAAVDTRFLCQSSSIEFLSCQSLDFNKVFRDGVSYLLPADADRLLELARVKHEEAKLRRRSSAEGQQQQQQSRALTVDSDKDRQFIDSLVNRAEEFLSHTFTDSETDTDNYFDIEPCNSYLRKLIYETVQDKFVGRLRVRSLVNERKQKHCRVERVITSDSEALDQQQQDQDRLHTQCREIEDARGFSKVIEIISQSGKLVVGHNMLLDLLHVIEHFITPLPQGYDEFKELMKCVFPRVLDTKYMASTEPFRDHLSSTVLSEMYRQLQHPPFVKPRVVAAAELIDCQYTADCGRLHEAGYDSFITGLSLITMINHLDGRACRHSDLLVDDPVLLNYCNKVHLMRMNDVTFINLAGHDAAVSRQHVYHLTFPRHWTAVNIQQLFAPFGGVQITWLSDSSAFTALRDQSLTQCQAVMKSLMSVSHRDYRLLTFFQHQQSLLTSHTTTSATTTCTSTGTRSSSSSSNSSGGAVERCSVGVKRAAAAVSSGDAVVTAHDDDSSSVKRRRHDNDSVTSPLVLSAPVQETAASAMIDDDVSELAAEPQHNPGSKLFEEPDTW